MHNKSCIVCLAEDGDGVLEEELEGAVGEILEDLDFSELDEIVNNIDINFNLFGGEDFKSYITKVIKGEDDIKIEDFFNIIVSSLKNSIKNILTPMLLIFIIVIFCVMFNNIKSGKLSGVSEIVFFICFSVIVVIVAKMSSGVIVQTKESLFMLKKQMNVIFPILLSLMGLVGGVSSVGVYTPMFAFLTNIISSVFIYFLLPLFSVSLILAILGNLSENTKLNKLKGFVSSLFKWVVGSVFAVFMGYIALKGVVVGTKDGISLKAARYAIKNYVPMLGGYISQGFELFKAGGVLVKNATGFVGIILLFATILSPLIFVSVFELGLKLMAGIIEPLGDKRSSNLLYDLGKSFKLLLVVLVGVALMYFLTVFLAMCSVSNIF